MPEIRLTLTDEQMARVNEAMIGLYDIPEGSEDGQPVKLFTEEEWPLEAIKRWLRQSVQRWEKAKARRLVEEVARRNELIL